MKHEEEKVLEQVMKSHGISSKAGAAQYMQSKIFKPQTLLLTLTFTNPLCFILGFWLILTFFLYASMVGTASIASLCFAFLSVGVLPYILCVQFFKARWRAVTFELKEKEIKATTTFLGFGEKSIRYKNIKQVELHQGIIQQMLGLATVVVTTQATAQNANIQLFDIKEYREVYEFLLEKLNEQETA
jgi:membrane protein YdbS with pleckstrin-like domain